MSLRQFKRIAKMMPAKPDDANSTSIRYPKILQSIKEQTHGILSKRDPELADFYRDHLKNIDQADRWLEKSKVDVERDKKYPDPHYTQKDIDEDRDYLHRLVHDDTWEEHAIPHSSAKCELCEEDEKNHGNFKVI